LFAPCFGLVRDLPHQSKTYPKQDQNKSRTRPKQKTLKPALRAIPEVLEKCALLQAIIRKIRKKQENSRHSGNQHFYPGIFLRYDATKKINNVASVFGTSRNGMPC